MRKLAEQGRPKVADVLALAISLQRDFPHRSVDEIHTKLKSVWRREACLGVATSSTAGPSAMTPCGSASFAINATGNQEAVDAIRHRIVEIESILARNDK